MKAASPGFPLVICWHCPPNSNFWSYRSRNHHWAANFAVWLLGGATDKGLKYSNGLSIDGVFLTYKAITELDPCESACKLTSTSTTQYSGWNRRVNNKSSKYYWIQVFGMKYSFKSIIQNFSSKVIVTCPWKIRYEWHPKEPIEFYTVVFNNILKK